MEFLEQAGSFFCTKAHMERAAAEIRRLRAEVDALRADRANLLCERRGEVWLWQETDGNDLDSLNCPVLISADALRAALQGGGEATREPDEWEAEYDDRWLPCGPSSRDQAVGWANMTGYTGRIRPVWHREALRGEPEDVRLPPAAPAEEER